VSGRRLFTTSRHVAPQALYGFLISSRTRKPSDEVEKLAENFRALDNSEKTAHGKVWTRRSDLLRALQAVYDKISAAIDRITEPGDVGEPA
jgi:hypothetical protein